MSDLTAFLRARLDEDEAAAKAAARYWDGVSVESATRAEPAHIDHHDPARVLREVEAKRAILAEQYGGPDHQDMWETIVRHLVAVWSNHPDYRQEWKP